MPEPPAIQAPVTVSYPVEWGQQDMFGHVNNVHYLRWFESARIAYLQRCGARMSSAGIAPILAAVHCDYVHQIRFPDTITVSASVSRIGNSSVTLTHEVWSDNLAMIAAKGESVVVLYDYREQKSVRIPDEVRQQIDAIEQGMA